MSTRLELKKKYMTNSTKPDAMKTDARKTNKVPGCLTETLGPVASQSFRINNSDFRIFLLVSLFK